MTTSPTSPSNGKDKIIKPITGYFKIQFEDGLYIISEDYKNEIKNFLSERTTSLTYLAKRHTIDEIAEFLKTEEHCKTIMQNARSNFQ